MKKRLRWILALLLMVAAGQWCAAQESDCYEPTREEGISLYNAKKYAEAIEQFEAAKYCPDKPSNDDLSSWIGKCHAAQQQADKAKQDEAEARKRAQQERERQQREQGEGADSRRKERVSDAASIRIIGVEFAEVDFNEKVLTGRHDPLYPSTQYLQPYLTYGNISGEVRKIALSVKIKNPSGKLMSINTSPSGYTYSIDLDMSADAETHEVALKKWGSTSGLYFETPGKYAFEIYCGGTLLHAASVEIQKKPEVVERVVTKEVASTTLNIDKPALHFKSTGGTEYVTVSTNASNWTLTGTSIKGFSITKYNSNTIKVVCDRSTSSASVNDWFKVLADGKEQRIVVYREAYNEAMAVKGNPFALRTSKRNTYHWGISAGYVTKHLKYKDKDGYTEEYGYLKEDDVQGISAGFHYEGFFMPRICGLGIATGAYYEYYWQKGDTDENDDWYAVYKEHSVYVPLDLVFRFDISKKVNIAFYGGVGANYGASNKIEYKDADSDDTFHDESNLYDYDEWGLKRFFMNIEYGGSLRIGRLSLNARFFAPLTDWSEDEYYSCEPVKNMNFGLSFMF